MDSEFKKNIEEILKKHKLTQLIVPDFEFLEEILENIQIPKFGTIIYLEDEEIRFYPNINESYLKNGIKRIKLTEKAGFITNYNSMKNIDNIYLHSLDLLKFDKRIINTNESGFIYVKGPEFYITQDKFLYLTHFYGTKQNKNESYFSPYFEFNDEILDKLEKGDFYMFNKIKQ